MFSCLTSRRAPNATLQAPLEAGARHERRLEAVSSSAGLDAAVGIALAHRPMPLCLQQTYKACLLKVVVCGKGFVESVPLHDHKTRTIDETPLLVWALGKQPPSLSIEARVQMRNIYVW